MPTLLQQEGYTFLNSLFEETLLSQLREEFDILKGEKLENKEISQKISFSRDRYDAEQKRFEIMNPPLLTRFYKSATLQQMIGDSIQERVRVNNRCGYYCYLEDAYIKPHFDHILTDCMLLVCLARTYGPGQMVGGLLKLYIPEKITFNRAQHKAEENYRVEEINLKVGEAVVVAGGHILHECTPIEKGGMRLVCGMGYLFGRENETQ